MRDNLTESEIANAKEQGANMDYYLPSGNEARIRKAYEQRDPRLEMSVITPYATYLGGDGGADNYFTNRYPFRSQWIETQNAMVRLRVKRVICVLIRRRCFII